MLTANTSAVRQSKVNALQTKINEKIVGQTPQTGLNLPTFRPFQTFSLSFSAFRSILHPKTKKKMKICIDWQQINNFPKNCLISEFLLIFGKKIKLHQQIH